jgi:hypothetical protein
MDPIANLETQRASAAEINAIVDRRTRGDQRDSDLTRIEELAGALAEHVEALDSWRIHGGFDPYAPAGAASGESMCSRLQAQLLAAVMHRIPMDVRLEVMHEVPAAYNAWCGRAIVTTQVNSAEAQP